MKPPGYVSGCCAAPVMVGGVGYGAADLTHWYLCEGCHQPCEVVDQLMPHEPFDIEDAEA